MVSKKIEFSIVLPTYTGLTTIGDTFNSILDQDHAGITCEIIVVIDGPSQNIRKGIERQKDKFVNRGVNFKIEQFKKNKGRFEARIAGAKLAEFDQLFFVDDRTYLEDDYFNNLLSIHEPLMLSNVIEKELGSSNIISATLFYIRRGLYGNKWGKDFKDYYIDKNNFEDTPKGTASLWIEKDVFLEACGAVANSAVGTSNRYVNEDTKILRSIIDKGLHIFRTSKLKIYYQTRSSFRDAVSHLYNRGPRFVDYYSRPGSKFFSLLIFIYLTAILFIGLLLTQPEIVRFLGLLVLVFILTTALRLGKDLKGTGTLLVGLPIVGIIFAAGVIKGAILKLSEGIRR